MAAASLHRSPPRHHISIAHFLPFIAFLCSTNSSPCIFCPGMPLCSRPHRRTTLLSWLALTLLLIVGDLGSQQTPSFVHAMGKVGGRQDIPGAQNDVKLENLAKFAVEQYNSQQNSNLHYIRLVSAQSQVVAGIMYYLKVEAKSGGHTKLYEAKVWVKEWENFKSLESFEPVQGSTVTSADLGANPDGLAANSFAEVGLRPVSSDDPVVKEAAEQALKDLQHRSNSLIPYELKDVLSALAEVTEDSTKFDLVLKVQRGAHEEECKAEVFRTVLGEWTVKQVHLHH